MLTKKIKNGIKGVYPFHMPGHKRNPKHLKNYAPLDVTEIEATDNLLNPTGVIKSAQKRTSALFKTKKTFYITGGSTTALHAAIKAVTKQNDTILLGRNCHKSVYSAAELLNLKPCYIYPKIICVLGVFGEAEPQKLDKLLTDTPASAVVITSPTYEGIVSDISSIAETVHRHGAVLIVDSAHGAHLGFSDKFPKSARFLGADIVIESAHKTLPCLTGAALLHICSDVVSKAKIAESIRTFASSSPPYPIIYSLDDMTHLLKRKGEKLFNSYNKKLDRFYEKALSLKKIFVYSGKGSFDFDKGKLCLITKNTNINGFTLKKLLLEKGVCCEMASENYCLAMTSIADTKRGFNRLFRALKQIDKTLCFKDCDSSCEVIKPQREKFPFEIDSYEFVEPEKAIGKISAEYIFAYPPGSPIIAPGEVITEKLVSYLKTAENKGAEIYSSSGKYPENIKISL